MKRIIGLDLGTASIGWSVVREAETDGENSEIVAAGVRSINFNSKNDHSNYEQGKSVTINSDRSMRRGARINNTRYKMRRDKLRKLLTDEGWIDSTTATAENGPGTTFETRRLRAKAASEPISLSELARVLLLLNKKRGYKSNRKASGADDGKAIDGIAVSVEMNAKGMTPGQYGNQLLGEGCKRLPDFYPSDLRAELARVADVQRRWYPALTPGLIDSLKGKNERQTWAAVAAALGAKGMKRTTKRGLEQKIEEYRWRAEALESRLGVEELTIVMARINAQASGGSLLLGAISDRSKVLVIEGKTIGQLEMEMLEKDRNTPLKGLAYYRQDYINEFDRIWSVQSLHHPGLTDELRDEIRDRIIFYQRPLKSKKGSIAYCEFESRPIEITERDADGSIRKRTVTKGLKVVPKSSPLFQEFRILQVLNNLTIDGTPLSDAEREAAAAELTWAAKMKGTELARLVRTGVKKPVVNFKEVEGNRTNARLLEALTDVCETIGVDRASIEEHKSHAARAGVVRRILGREGVDTRIMDFDSTLGNAGNEMELQPAYSLWHLLYSAEDDDSATGTENLQRQLREKFGFDEAGAAIMAGVTFEDDYGSLSAKAIRKLLPLMKQGMKYSEACAEIYGTHSRQSKTRAELDATVYTDRLELLRRGELRNPVVERIINQMINVVNKLVEVYGRPDEIRIELAREMKKSAAERASLTAAIGEGKRTNDRIAAILAKPPYNISRPSRNDILRYRLYEELEPLGYKTPYSGTYIAPDQLYSGSFDFEHILPKARVFDDSFSNKTLEIRDVNIDKGADTAIDFVARRYGPEGVAAYRERVALLLASGKISKSKHDNLLKTAADIDNRFLNRELNDTQYIARKAREILLAMVPVVTSTVGAITARLRDDWQITEVMKELDWDKYDRQGLTTTFTDRHGKKKTAIVDWTKRNDNRHHAMDAIAIAFTRPEFIQYLNTLNARGDRDSVTRAIERKWLCRDKNNALRFRPPMPVDIFRGRVKEVLEGVLVSFKPRSKVLSRNTNITRGPGNTTRRTVQLTPRGGLHNDTIYGAIRVYATRQVKVDGKMDEAMVAKVSRKAYREALAARLAAHGGDAKKAFTGKNSPARNPIYIDAAHSTAVPDKVTISGLETRYTARKKVDASLKVDKVIDEKIKDILRDRLNAHGGKADKAFANLDDDPIYLNREQGITIKRVTVSGPTEVLALHDKRDHNGRPVTDADGRKIATDFVQTSGNHHVALFETPDGKVEEVLVSMFEATARALAGGNAAVIDRNYRRDEGWRFLMSLKINEFVMFPRCEQQKGADGRMVEVTTFDPGAIDLTDPANFAAISPNLFRVQKLSTKNYVFRHHLETTVDEVKELRDITWKRITAIQKMKEAVKVKVDNIGRIVGVGD